jgi:two-component sensor histidine kinase
MGAGSDKFTDGPFDIGKVSAMPDPNDSIETADERTIRLLHAEIALLRRRATYADKAIRRIEAMADVATQQTALRDEEVALLRKRLSHSHWRARELNTLARNSAERAADRAAMLHEVNHRAKNSIQMAMTLLNLQRHASSDDEVRLSLATAIERLGHIARIHTMLYTRPADQQTIEFAEYLRAFCSELRLALHGDVEIVCIASDKLAIDASRATNLALIASEAVTNAIKHAFPGRCGGTISVQFSCMDGQGMLTVHDNGAGMKEHSESSSLGLRLIQTLVKSIHGFLSIESEEGTRIEVTFPVDGKWQPERSD